MDRFDQFMAICKDAPDTATDFVKSLGVDSTDAPALVTKYARQYSRLQMDLRHERESMEAKIRFQYEEGRRQIQQRFEVDASELGQGGLLTFDATPTTGLGSILFPSIGGAPTVSVTGGNVQLAAIANAAATSSVAGVGSAPEWSAEEKAILDAIRDKIAGSSIAETLSLEADLHVAKDETAQPQTRQNAVSRLKNFAERNKSTIADAAFRALVEYLPKLL